MSARTLYTRDGLVGATAVCLRGTTWYPVVRLNRISVTVKVSAASDCRVPFEMVTQAEFPA